MAFFKLVFVMCVCLISQFAIADDVLTCSPGYYISDNTCVRAPAGAVSPGGTSTDVQWCIWRSYANADQSECVPCPPEYPYTGYGVTSIKDCFRICLGGTYMAHATDTECTPVGPDSWAPPYKYIYGHDANTDNTLRPCPTGTRTRGALGYGADDATDCALTLHVGDYALRAIGVKKTRPALAVSFNGATYWAQMSVTSTPMNNTTTGMLRTSVGDTEYWVHDDTIVNRTPYSWESPDYDWGEKGKYSFDESAKTWSVKFADSTWAGLARCTGDWCECQMLTPAVSNWAYYESYSNCEERCALECSWGFANGPGHKFNLITAVPE